MGHRWMGGWMEGGREGKSIDLNGCMDGYKNHLRIDYSKQKIIILGGWMGGWVGVKAV